jgi:DNA-binding transcriptional regulator YiaG
MTIKCDCGGEMRAAELRAVDLRPIFGIAGEAERAEGERCDRCGFETVTGAGMKRLERALVSAVLSSETRLPAPEAKLLRRFLDVTQAELATRMGVTRKTLALWETRGGISTANDYMLRGLCAAELGGRQALAALREPRLRAPLKRPKPLHVRDAA